LHNGVETCKEAADREEIGQDVNALVPHTRTSHFAFAVFEIEHCFQGMGNVRLRLIFP
jgi:hypothetical protein